MYFTCSQLNNNLSSASVFVGKMPLSFDSTCLSFFEQWFNMKYKKITRLQTHRNLSWTAPRKVIPSEPWLYQLIVSNDAAVTGLGVF